MRPSTTTTSSSPPSSPARSSKHTFGIFLLLAWTSTIHPIRAISVERHESGHANPAGVAGRSGGFDESRLGWGRGGVGDDVGRSGLWERRATSGDGSVGTSDYIRDLRTFQAAQQVLFQQTLSNRSSSSSSSLTSSSYASDLVLNQLSASATDDTQITGLDGWHIDTISTLVMEELDPVVSPNAQGSHMHNVFGGNNFGASYNYAQTQESTCSSVSIQSDFSNYWVPQLYWINDIGQTNQTFTAVPAFIRFYYHLGRNTLSTPVQAFPQGLRMLLGNPDSKLANATTIVYTCHTKADYTDDLARPDFNFNDTCAWGMKTELNFPACWDGYNLYKSDQSHMAEHTWHTYVPAPGKTLAGNLAWANGDTTGGAMHGDFVAGWQPGVLEAALIDPDCVNLNKSIAAEYCPSLLKYMNTTTSAACVPIKGVLEEPLGNAGANVTALPGCNLLWGNTTDKPTCDPAVAALDVNAFKGTDGPLVVNASLQQNNSLPAGTNWTFVSCLYNMVGAPIWLDNATSYEYTDTKNSVARCTRSCELNGMPFTGLTVEGTTFRCGCSSAFNPGAGVQPGECSTPCPGNKTDLCGGSNVYQVLYKAEANLQSATSSDLSYIGCMVDGGWIDAAGYTYTASAMNVSSCAKTCVSNKYQYSGLVNGDGCYCSNSIAAGTGNFVPDDSCSTACSGNSTQMCGGASLISLYNNDVSTSGAGARISLASWSWLLPTLGVVIAYTQLCAGA